MALTIICSMAKTTKRVKVKGHYRTIVRDAEGKIVSSKKWSPKKKRR